MLTTDPIEQANLAAEAMVKRFNGELPREVFEFILTSIKANAEMAFNAAKGLSFLTCSARDLARQRRMNQMVENGIIMLEELTNITVCCRRNENVNQVPFPPMVDGMCYRQTMLNFDNKR